MAGEIEAAMHRLDERKRSALGGEISQGSTVVDHKTYLMMFSGLDLDPDELHRVKLHVALSFVIAAQGGCDPIAGAAELFADGIATGMLIAGGRGEAGRD